MARAKSSNPDVLYKDWLTKPRKVDVPFTPKYKAMVADLLEKAGGEYKSAARISGVNRDTLRKLHPSTGKTKRASVTVEVLEKVAMYFEKDDEVLRDLDQYIQTGKPGWSEESDHCLECGTFFHDHYHAGYCRECYLIHETGIGVPRDARLGVTI